VWLRPHPFTGIRPRAVTFALINRMGFALWRVMFESAISFWKTPKRQSR
jgi:hypothetical protein